MPKKTISLILAMLLLVSLLCACHPAPPGTTDPAPAPTTKPTTASTTVPAPTNYDPTRLVSELTARAKAIFLARAGLPEDSDAQICIFGAFDGNYAVLVRSSLAPGVPTWETVNGLTFYYPDGIPLFMEDPEAGMPGGRLWENFSRQEITAEQLRVIYDNYYSAYPELLSLVESEVPFTSVIPFAEDAMHSISEALLALTGEALDWDDKNSIGSNRLMYYCTLEGKHIFRWIPYQHSPTFDMKDQFVGNYHFEYTEEFQLYAFNGVTLMTLAQAYEQGIFTEEQIKAIYYYHEGVRAYG